MRETGVGRRKLKRNGGNWKKNQQTSRRNFVEKKYGCDMRVHARGSTWNIQVHASGTTLKKPQVQLKIRCYVELRWTVH